MSPERIVFMILFGTSVVLGLWFVLDLGPPWRSQLPGTAWLQASLAAVVLALDLVIVLLLLRVPVPWWLIAVLVAAQDAVFVWRLVKLHEARRSSSES
jgi:hypothetical protein